MRPNLNVCVRQPSPAMEEASETEEAEDLEEDQEVLVMATAPPRHLHAGILTLFVC